MEQLAAKATLALNPLNGFVPCFSLLLSRACRSYVSATIVRWLGRDFVEDASHTPHRLQTTLSPAQEVVVVDLRRLLLLPLDDLLVIAREFINAKVSRSGLDRCLRRHGVSRLAELKPQAEATPNKTFKDHEPGYVHIDINYLPQMPDEDHRQYLFVAIDRATRWVHVAIKRS